MGHITKREVYDIEFGEYHLELTPTQVWELRDLLATVCVPPPKAPEPELFDYRLRATTRLSASMVSPNEQFVVSDLMQLGLPRLKAQALVDEILPTLWVIHRNDNGNITGYTRKDT